MARTKAGDFIKPVVSAGVAVVLDQALLDPLASKLGLGIEDDIVKFGVATFAKQTAFGKGKNIKNALTALQIISAANFVRGTIGGKLGGLFGGNGGAMTSNSVADPSIV